MVIWIKVTHSCSFVYSSISCLTMCNLPWFMDLTSQFPVQYCFLQHQILLSSPDTSTTDHCVCFGQSASFFLELLIVVLRFSPVAYWIPSDLGVSFFCVISFCLFIQFMGFSGLVYWSGLPFPPPVGHILSELSTRTCPSWVALHGMANSFIELCKPLHHDKAVIHEGVIHCKNSK